MNLFTFTPEQTQGCSVTAWLHQSRLPRPAIVICPGGGYDHLSRREADPVAEPYFAAGYHVFILSYSVGADALNLTPLCQLANTVAHIRKNCEEWLVHPEKIAVCGFSAGGHLAGSLGTLFNTPEFSNAFQRFAHIRPDAMVLAYPVITADEHAHSGSIEAVSGAKEGSEEYLWFDLAKHVDKDTPPTFLWHTAEDPAVPVENSLKFAMALSQAKIPFECHVFPTGGHGTSVCTKEVGSYNPYNARWMGWSIQWLNTLFQFEN